jgi:hypothetical protein
LGNWNVQSDNLVRIGQRHDSPGGADSLRRACACDAASHRHKEKLATGRRTVAAERPAQRHDGFTSLGGDDNRGERERTALAGKPHALML